MKDSLRELLRFLSAGEVPETLILACDHSPRPRVPRRACALHYDACWGEAPLGSLAQILALGVGRIDFVPCSRDGGLSRLLQLGDKVFPGRLRLWDEPHQGRFTGKWVEVSRLGVSRRSFLGLSTTCALDLNANWQERSAQAFALLGVREPPPDPPPSWTLQVSGCNVCGVCVAACPHQALSLTPDPEDANLLTLTQDLARCEADGTCLKLCPPRTLAVQGHPTWAEIHNGAARTLAAVKTKVCPSCHNRFPAGTGELCPLCAFRQDHPFGAAPPDMFGAGARPGASETTGKPGQTEL
ncbi:4Fe-4S dicluster domain-containing protein [uncultured Mobiluncus sp.]|uniref:4Fe-4S dicluster domain-containing protein n=1 Tax=uncultured Mobiluncus sp. TaxID=293425 RepID=UPI0026143D53|nr:4Fe-4S dicluster domain-containing protein [uncultured Mobiluncus sp.]